MTAQTPGSHAPAAFGGPSGGQTDSASTTARIRAEAAAALDKPTQALLLHECGVRDESAGEEPVAARDYLAAFNADPQFREPLEALVRILTKRKSVKNLGKLLDALTRAAITPEEKARAFWERASFLQDFEQNLAGAKDSLEEAVGSFPEDATPWLELELIAAKEGDLSGRMRAIEARAELATDPTWKQLLYIDLAELNGRQKEFPRAYELLDGAAAVEGRARFKTRTVLEAIAIHDENHDALARALEGQAELIIEALSDPEAADAAGVPRTRRTAAHAADALFRAAEVRRRAGENDEAAQLLARAAERLPESAVLARARLVALEAAGDAEGASAIAKKELARGAGGAGAASLWLRVAEAAALSGDRDAALSALRSALTADPGCIPARALELDLLGDGQEPGALASSLEAMAETLGTEAAKGRAYLLAAHVWAAHAGDVGAAKAALSQAAMCGVPPGIVSRVARSLASLRGDGAWYEESTKRLLAAGAEPTEVTSLWFELGRSRLLRGDRAGASEAFAKLAAAGGHGDEPGPSAWLGRALAAYASPLARAEGETRVAPAAEPLDALARVEHDPAMARALVLVAALRAARSGDLAGARSRLQELHAADPAATVPAVFLAELERRAGDGASAARALAACAVATDDGDLAGALHLEAAVLAWRASQAGGGEADRKLALDELEAARAGAPRAASAMLNWALLGADADSLEGRRRALEVAADAGADEAVAALERFGLEVALGGDPAEALAALEKLERQGTEDLATAGALARLVWPQGVEHGDAARAALELLEDRGGAASCIARAEAYRFARAVDQDREAAVKAASAWADVEPKPYAALEWIGAAMAAGDRDAEATARKLIARSLDGEAAAAVEASAAAVTLLGDRHLPLHLVAGEYASAQLMNLELAGPGCDPRRRAAALHGLDGALGTDAQIEAIALAGWSYLAGGQAEEALEAFRSVTEQRPDDVAAWEGTRASAEALGDHVAQALASAQLGALCKDDARGAEFWERAGLIILEHTDAHDDAEIAFERAFDRDPGRAVAYDKLFRRVRAKNEDDRLLGIIGRRLEVAEDTTEIAKMHWERARVLRKKGDRDAALAALEDVTMLEPDHVGALALAGEIQITKGAFAAAAPLLARLATIPEAPTQQRLMSGVAAVNLYENKLNQPEKGLAVLVGLHQAGLSTLPVRERLGRAAAKVGAWKEAVSILAQLMNEREKPEGRVEAARLCMAIYRDKLGDAMGARAAVEKLLDEAPDDGEALDLVLTTSYDSAFRTRALGRAKTTLVQKLAKDPFDPTRVSMLAKIAGAGQDQALRQATLGTLIALGESDKGLNDELTRIDSRVAARPQIALDARAMGEIADPEDDGPIAEIFAHLAETISLSIGPSAMSLGVTKKERVEGRGGHPLRVAVAEWMGALGFEGDFDLYIGGPEPRGVNGIAGEQPAIVLGSGITTPLDAAARSAIAREVFALRRGITAVRTRDDAMIHSVIVAACIEAGLPAQNPGLAVFGEVSRGIKKEISRKTKKAILEPCQRFLQTRQDPRAWAQAARRSIDRMAVIAAGDVSLVLADILATPRERLVGIVTDSDRARRLLSFVLSPNYLELRKKLGMGVR